MYVVCMGKAPSALHRHLETSRKEALGGGGSVVEQFPGMQ